jgi:hypothetical protein
VPDLEMDTEVRVEVTVTPPTASSLFYTVKINALSLDHSIDKIVLYKGGLARGKTADHAHTWTLAGGDYTEGTATVDAPKSDDTSKKPADSAGWVPKTTSHAVSVTNSPGSGSTASPQDIGLANFPLLVEIYEAGDPPGTKNGEGPDCHRHGWFDDQGNLCASQEHTVKKGWPTVPSDRNRWYGHWPGGCGNPPSFKEDNK